MGKITQDYGRESRGKEKAHREYERRKRIAKELKELEALEELKTPKLIIIIRK